MTTLYDLQEIKDRISCVDYARQNGISVAKPGDRTYSPFHNGKNKTSFMCYEKSWYSFSDDVGGDVIDLCAILKHNGDKGAAIRELAALAGIKSNVESSGWRDYTQDLGNRVFYWNTQLTKEDYEYLHSRGINDDTINSLKIGRNEEGRLVIPYWKNGYVAYYATRHMPGGKFPDAKYRKMKIDNYNEHVPWGLDSLSHETDTLIIPEGAFDALSFWQEGYAVLSAITGHFSKSQMPYVIAACGNFDRIILTFDNDYSTHAGEKFTLKLAKILFNEKIPFYVAPVPARYKDISEYYADGGSLQQLIASAQPGIKYICSTFREFDDLKRFILSIARSTDAATLGDIMQGLPFGETAIKELVKIAKNCPLESIIADEITSKHTLIYVQNDSFYEWNESYWERISELTVQSYADKQYGRQFSTAQRIKNVTSLLKSRCNTDTEFNRKPVMTFLNGSLELETGVFRGFSQVDYCSFALPYKYDTGASCEVWEAFIEDVTAGDSVRAESLQLIAGYVLFPDCRFQKVFALMGAGGNGKSVYLDTLEAVFARENCTHVDPSNMPNEFWLIHLKDSLLNYATEIDADFSKSEKYLKSLSDGTTMQACYKGQNHITFKPRAKQIFACNATPKTRTIAGMDRRMFFVDFPCTYKDDPDPKNPLEKPKNINLQAELLTELPGIFNWVYAGYKTLMQVGYFTDTQEQADYMREFRQSSNPIEVFISDHIFAGRMTRNQIYSMYGDWCTETGHMKQSRETFFPAFMKAMKRDIVGSGREQKNGAREMVIYFAENPAKEPETHTQIYWDGGRIFSHS